VQASLTPRGSVAHIVPETELDSLPCTVKFVWHGTGYCKGSGKYEDTVEESFAECQQLCASEPQCVYVRFNSKKLKCSRYDSRAEPCDKLGGVSAPYDTYAKQWEGSCMPAQTYEPGTPGAEWTPEVKAAIRQKIVQVFEEPGAAWEGSRFLDDKQQNFKAPDLPKFVRLAFHDCLLYKDGSGGCDGCLNFHNMGEVFTKTSHLDPEKNDDGHSNGLGGTVAVLEAIYDDAQYPAGAAVLEHAPKELGISRADLWAYAAIVAVEVALEKNNEACRKPTNDPDDCAQDWGQPDCAVTAPRALIFSTGRKDCLPNDSLPRPYMTLEPESHPGPAMSGKDVAAFMKSDFQFTARESVAIMGAHTLGKFHAEISGFAYNWKRLGLDHLNNGYYKTMLMEPDWSYQFNPKKIGECKGFANSSGMKPIGDYEFIFPRKEEQRPQFKSVRLQCPCYKAFDQDTLTWNLEHEVFTNGCCDATDPWNGCETGCDEWRGISGIEETMLNSDIGLHREFVVTSDNIAGGCPGLENYNSASGWQGATGWRISNCPLNTYRDPPDDEPMHKIVEDYAKSSESWLRDFYPAYEKMLANGYGPSELTPTELQLE